MTNMEMVVSNISRIIEFVGYIFVLCVNVANQGQQIPNGSLSLSKLQLNRFNTTNGVSYKGKMTVK